MFNQINTRVTLAKDLLGKPLFQVAAWDDEDYYVEQGMTSDGKFESTNPGSDCFQDLKGFAMFLTKADAYEAAKQMLANPIPMYSWTNNKHLRDGRKVYNFFIVMQVINEDNLRRLLKDVSYRSAGITIDNATIDKLDFGIFDGVQEVTELDNPVKQS